MYTKQIVDTTQPYRKLDYQYISYSVCRDYDNISRYRGLRQVVHSPYTPENRFISLESPNSFTTNDTAITWHTVTGTEVDRLDLIAFHTLGSAEYRWVIAYFNKIEDGYTCYVGQKLMIPNNISDLMKSGEILQEVPALSLNLGTE